MKIVYMTCFLIVTGSCAETKDDMGSSSKKSVESSPQEVTAQSTSVNLNSSSSSNEDRLFLACSRDMTDISQPPQKPYVAYAYSTCRNDKVPAFVMGCNIKLIEKNNGNIVCNESKEMSIDGIDAGKGSFICIDPKHPGSIPGCNSKI